MGQIFISYCRRDTEIIDPFVNAMCEAGLDVWIDRQDIQAGNPWRVQIVEAIDTCDAFVLMLSSNSAASDNVRKELDLAQDAGRRILPIMLEPIKIPATIHYQLAGLQFIDVKRLGFDAAVCQLTHTIQEHIARLKPVEERKTCQAELVIKGIDLKAFGAEKGEQLLNFVAQLTNTSRSGLAIANLAAGSLHVFIDMPARPAYELKTLALNRDRRFKTLGIHSLRLAGNAKYINIALGILTAAATIGFLQALWLSTPSLLAPVVGETASKILALSYVIVYGTAVVIIVGTTDPATTETPIAASSSTETFTPTSTPTTSSTPTPTFTPTGTATQTATPSPTPPPQNPLVLKDTLCWFGPDYAVVGVLKKDTRVILLGRSRDNGWRIVDHPRFHVHPGCWVRKQYLQIESGTDVELIIAPPLLPTRTHRPFRPQPTTTPSVTPTPT